MWENHRRREIRMRSAEVSEILPAVFNRNASHGNSHVGALYKSKEDIFMNTRLQFICEVCEKEIDEGHKHPNNSEYVLCNYCFSTFKRTHH